MCVIVNFYEVFAPGMWVTGGWIEGIPDGRGIRHYDAVNVCRDKPYVNTERDSVVIPNTGLVQIERDDACPQCADTDVDADVWAEYDLLAFQPASSTAGTSMLVYRYPMEKCVVLITVKERESEDMKNPEDPHKSIGESPVTYGYTVSAVSMDMSLFFIEHAGYSYIKYMEL